MNQDRQLELMELVMQASISLSEIQDFDALISNMAATALTIGSCEGTTIYRAEKDQLRFLCTLNKHISSDIVTQNLKNRFLPIDDATIAGHCARTRRLLNLEDVYNLPSPLETTFNRRWDMINNYRSKSMLVIPMCDSQGDLLGVMQLINHLEHGAVKPFPAELERFLRALANQCGIILRNTHMANELRRSRIEAVKKFVLTSEFHDPDTGGHIERMGHYSGFLYSKIGKSRAEVDDMSLAAMLHDVGKIAIPDRVLKKPGSLTTDEWNIMKTHAQMGHDMLIESESPLLQIGAIVAQAHHEKWNGSGYPFALQGDHIPIEGRIVAIADVFDALCSKRCYKEGWPLERVLDHMTTGAGIHFDPGLLSVFIDNMDAVLELRRKISPELGELPGVAAA